ncbi:uncharacterized protein LOC113587492 [Electrophorus electricus]|uniref:exodeoxyribonuclease III n=1 Tax=Electrophorus electricus TaxID=8005 RepID=A0AAY5EA57_ELEEL|nr:uncharacterized protein LOC118242392 [Electrophorus electricus]XP_035389165.1 uncharacterized protein LOC113587492 [Electrophorus electricus]
MASAHPETLHVLTWNVNGLPTALHPNKRVDPETNEHLFSKIIKDAHVVLLQETHIGKKNENVIQKLSSNWHLHYTVYNTKQRGVAILVNKKLQFLVLEEFKHSDGEYIVLQCEIEGQTYILVSVYNHSSDKRLLSGLSDHLQQYTTGVLVIGGDFNTVLNPYMDKQYATVSKNHSALLPSLKKFMRAHQLVDVWRRSTKIKCFYTFYRNNSNSRIDYFFLPEECVWRVKRCEINDVPSDDHLPISLYLNSEDSAANIPLNPIVRARPWEESILWMITSREIEEAIKSLQVSDTPRPNGRPVSYYKQRSPEVIQELIGTYHRICDGLFNFDNTSFSASFAKQNFHFFNVDYVILATILARHLECSLKLRNHRRVDYETHVPIYYCIVGHDVISVEWGELEKAISNVLQAGNPLLNILERMLPREGSRILLYYGCPLTPVLRSFLVRNRAEDDLEQNLNVTPAEPLRVYGDDVIAVIPRVRRNFDQDLECGAFIVRRGTASVLHVLPYN